MKAYQPPSSSLDLTENRLSGVIPPALRISNATVDVLQGNIFGCPLLLNDEMSNVTPCGSSNLEYPFIAWIAMLLLAVIVAICLSYFSKRKTVRVQQFLSDWLNSAYVESRNSSSELYHTMNTMSFLDHACSMVVVLIVLFVIVVMISFIVIKLQTDVNSLYQVQYLYTTTTAYLIGRTPAAMIWLYVTLSGLVVIVLCVAKKTTLRYQHRGKRIDNNDTSEGVQVYQDSVKSIIVRIVLELLVSTIAIAINYGFVQIVYVRQPSNVTVVNMAFAIIKYVMNILVIPFSTKLVSKAHKQSHSVFMSIMVNVIGPAFAALISSPLCLLQFFKKKSISASYEYPSFECHSLTGCQVSDITAVSVVTPDWVYSYQCSSSFLKSYLPNFTYLYIINGVLSPLVKLLAMIVLSTGIAANYTSYTQRQSFFFYLNYLLRAVDDNLMIGGIFYTDNDEAMKDPTSSESKSTDIEMTVKSKRSSHDSITSKESMQRISRLSNEISNEISKRRDKGYDPEVEGLMPSLCVDIIMLLTFGLASPLFALVVAFSITINTLLWRLALGRYISIVSKAMSRRACYEKLEIAFEDEWRCLPRSWWLISILVGLFWSMFIFDMIGDTNRIGGILAAVIMAVWCPCIFLLLQWLLTFDPDSDNRGSGRTIDRIRYRVHDISLHIHDITWRHVLRLMTNDDTNSSKSSIVSRESVKAASYRITTNNIATSARNITISETISPLESIHTTRASSHE